MNLNADINEIVAELSRMSVSDLRQRYTEIVGEPVRTSHKLHLIKRIAWRVQALREGDLPERARRRALELASDTDLRVTPPRAVAGDDGAGQTVEASLPVTADSRLPLPGTLLRRQYKGRVIQVRVLPRGFELDGEVYRSLTAVARKITGSHWNGWQFFKLGPARLHEEA